MVGQSAMHAVTQKPRGRLAELGFGVATAANGGLRAEVRRAALAKLAHDLATSPVPVIALGIPRERRLLTGVRYFYVPVVRTDT